MADALTIGDLPAASGGAQGTDLIEIQRGTGAGSSQHLTLAEALALAGANASTGDMKLTAGDPGAGWLKAGAVYPQASYPNLFAMIGLIGDEPPGKTWAANPTTPTGKNAIAALSDSILVTCGNNVISRSTNGGATWTDITVTGNLLMIANVGDGVALAAGVSGVILRTTDYGATWTAVTSGTSSTIRSLLVFSPTAIVAVCDTANQSRRSTNGGQTWSAAGISSAGMGNVLRFSGMTAVVHGSGNGSATPGMRSIDAGATWSSVSLPISSGAVSSGCVFNAKRGIVHGTTNVLAVTDDAGATWASVTAALPTAMSASAALLAISETRAVAYRSDGSTGSHYLTDDAGVTWAAIGTFTVGASTSARLALLLDKAAFVLGSSGLYRSGPEYYYDTATMFRTPKAGQVTGYIKA